MKRFLLLIALLISMAIVFTGCKGASQTSGGDGKDTEDAADEDATDEEENDQDDSNSDSEEESTDEDTTEDESSSETEENEEDASVVSSGDFTCISDISDYWNKLYETNEEVINAYQGLETLTLVTPGLYFITGVQYDVLNIYNEDGHYEGNLLLAGYPAYLDKKGSDLTFGYEEVLDEDGYTATMKVGDKKVESGSCNLEKGYYYSESYTDRAGSKITRSTSEFKKESDGSMCTLIQDGSTLNYNGEEDLNTSYIFMRVGEGYVEYVSANSDIGTAFEDLRLNDNMTKESAIDMLLAAGATIESSGGIKDGVFVVD